MGMPLQMNPKMAEVINPNLHKTKSRQKATISCRADALAMLKKKTNFYEVLSLRSENVGFDQIKKAYRGMALQYHPDVCPPSAKEESTKRFVELQKAYEILSNPISRRMHDYELGLVNSLGFDFDGFGMKERKNNFPKEVWEKQLYGLKQRSHARTERKKNK